MRAIPLLVVPLVLAACTQGPARPDRVELTRDLLQVRMSDGTVCEGIAHASGAEAGWSGSLTSCPWAYDYVVEIDPQVNPLRFVMEEFFTAIGLDQALRPIADVTIMGEDGRSYRFVSPPDNLVDAGED